MEWTPKNKKVLMVVDGPFRATMRGDDVAGQHLKKIYNEYLKNGTSIVRVGPDEIILPQHCSSDFTEGHGLKVTNN